MPTNPTNEYWQRIEREHAQMKEALVRIESRAQELADRGGKIDALECAAIAEQTRAALSRKG